MNNSLLEKIVFRLPSNFGENYFDEVEHLVDPYAKTQNLML